MTVWFRKKPLPAIPPYQPPIEVRPVPPKDEPYIVEKVDMSATGIFKIFGRRPKGE
jgi:hypothetical protein